MSAWERKTQFYSLEICKQRKIYPNPFQYCNGENKNCSSDETAKTRMKQNSESEEIDDKI